MTDTGTPAEPALHGAIDGLYEEFAAADVQYGPAFQGLCGVWRLGDEVFAEVSVPEERRDEAGRFGLHPVLLDAALQAAHLAQDPADGDESGAPRLPFAWSDVELYADGAKSLRVRLSRSGSGGDTVSVLLADDSGAPVARVGSLVSRAVDVRQGLATRRTRVAHLYRVNWVRPAAVDPARAEAATAAPWAVLGTDAAELARLLGADGVDVTAYPALADLTAAVAAGTASAPGVVVAAGATVTAAGTAADADTDAESVHAAARDALALVQEWLSAADGAAFADARLVVLTRGAAAVTDDEPLPGLAHSAVLGLLRSAQSEEPGRFVLADVDGTPESLRALPAAYAQGEPECAIRAGAVLVPRLTRDLGAPTGDLEAPAAPVLDPHGTALVTGAPGGLGGLVARHLVAAHGIRHLLFLGRRGPEAPGAAELAAHIEESGATIDVVACDAADRDALADALARVPAERPLTAVVHTAGVFDDGITSSLTAEQLDRVLRPKADAALNLRALTRDAMQPLLAGPNRLFSFSGREEKSRLPVGADPRDCLPMAGPREIERAEGPRLTRRRALAAGALHPGSGHPHAHLAPGAHGSNRTGRNFTGDASGAFFLCPWHFDGLALPDFDWTVKSTVARTDLFHNERCTACQ